MDIYEFIEKLEERAERPSGSIQSALHDMGPEGIHILFYAFEILVDMIKNGTEDA